jgi:hypothetical protein
MWTDKLWVYDLRTNQHFTLKQKLTRHLDFDEFVECYKPGRMHERVETWNEANPEGRWRCFGYNDLLKRDKLSLDLFWIKNKTLTDTDSLPPPDIIAAEIADGGVGAVHEPRMDEVDRDTLMRMAASTFKAERGARWAAQATGATPSASQRGFRAPPETAASQPFLSPT